MTELQTQRVDSATSIDEVIERLDSIIEGSRQQNSRLGSFAALYREVTIQVRQGIAAGDFENGDRNINVLF